MRNAPCRTWNIARKLKKKIENETQKLFDLEYSEKHSKTWKMRNAHCMTRKRKIMENEKHTL